MNQLYSGGKPPEESFMLWVCKNYNYFDEHLGRPEVFSRIMVGFTVTEQGDVIDVKILRSVDPLLDTEAVRTVSSSPKWSPAKLKGTPVKTEHKTFVHFKCVADYNYKLYHQAERFYKRYINVVYLSYKVL